RANEHELAAALDIPRFQSEVATALFRETLEVPEVRDPNRDAAPVVNPAVILALQRPVPFRLPPDRAEPVRTNVQKASQLAAEVLHDDRFSADSRKNVVAVAGEVTGESGKLPEMMEEAGVLAGESFRGAVVFDADQSLHPAKRPSVTLN